METSEIVEQLLAVQGVYEGEGVNEEGEPFLGVLVLDPMLDGAGAIIQYIAASADDDKVYHQEHSVVHRDSEGALGMWSFNSSSGLTVLRPIEADPAAVEGIAHSFLFGVGEIEDRSVFRERVRLDMHEDGCIGYCYSWGLPDGDFSQRSLVLLEPLADFEDGRGEDLD